MEQIELQIFEKHGNLALVTVGDGPFIINASAIDSYSADFSEKEFASWCLDSEPADMSNIPESWKIANNFGGMA